MQTALRLSVLICAAILLFYRLGDRELWASHEARAAQDAQTMLDTGDWLLPRLFDGTPELQKPPLYYWLVGGIGWLNGGRVNEIIERLPAALAAFGTVLLLLLAFRAGRRPVAGVMATTVLLTAQHFTWIGRTGRIDVPLTFTVTAAVMGLRSDQWRWQFTAWLAIAAGVMLKGPLGAIIPGAIVGVGLATGDVPAVLRGQGAVRRVCCGTLLVLALTVPWFVAVHLRTDGEFSRVFFWHHHVQRATGSADTLATHPWWFYAARWTVDTLPWSPLVIVAACIAMRSPWLREDRLARFGCVWMLSVTLLLSLSRFKRADYLLPAYPGFAIALGCLCERLCLSFHVRAVAAGVLTTLGAAVTVSIVLLHTLVPRMDGERAKRQFAADIRTAAPAPEQILLFRVEDHLLGWHLGRPVNSLLEWENLDVWAGRPGNRVVVMPANCAAEWRQHIDLGLLEEICRFTDRTDRRTPRDLVAMRMQSLVQSAARSPR